MGYQKKKLALGDWVSVVRLQIHQQIVVQRSILGSFFLSQSIHIHSDPYLIISFGNLAFNETKVNTFCQQKVQSKS